MPRKYDDEDDDDLRPVRKRELSGLDGMFANTNMVVLVLFGLCCNGLCFLPLILSIIGVTTCTDETARSNAKIVMIISIVMSMPEQKCLPLPDNTATRASAVISTHSKACLISRQTVSLIALALSGRLISMCAI